MQIYRTKCLTIVNLHLLETLPRALLEALGMKGLTETNETLRLEHQVPLYLQSTRLKVTFEVRVHLFTEIQGEVQILCYLRFREIPRLWTERFFPKAW